MESLEEFGEVDRILAEMHKTIEIRLGKEGRFFSGRSHAVEIVSKFLPQNGSNRVAIDFKGVESFSQSFISELINQLKNHGIPVENISFSSLLNKDIQERAERELERFKRLTG